MEAGSRLGPYEIRERLGAGGMGEVWLARDTRLGREVAIKVLPAEFAGDPERLARFQQEARAAAALNHPHIAIVHDVGAETGAHGAAVHFMVQEPASPAVPPAGARIIYVDQDMEIRRSEDSNSITSFTRGGGRLMSVSVARGNGGVRAGIPEPVPGSPTDLHGGNFDVAPDGRILLVEPVDAAADDTPAARIVVVLDWLPGLRRMLDSSEATR